MIPGLERFELVQAMAKSSLAEHKALSSLFRYAKIKGDTLFFVFSHPGAKMEFSYKKNLLLESLRSYYKLQLPQMKEQRIVFKKIEAVVIYPKPSPAKAKTKSEYFERSTGDFDIQCEDPGLRRRFENIKKIIKARHDASSNKI